jgi:uncharacterized membrane protein YfhO
LSEIHYPAWKASINNEQIPVFRADYALRAMEVPEGKHRVRCWFESGSFKQGLLITVASWLVFVIFALKAFFDNRKIIKAGKAGTGARIA